MEEPSMSVNEHELIVVGGGPAGLSASLTTRYYKTDVLVIEAGSAGGALVNAYPWKKVDNYLGFKGMTGLSAAKAMVEHVKAEGVKINENETVTDIRRDDLGINVETTKGRYKAKAAILTVGLGMPRRLGVPGENLENVVYCLPDPAAFKGKKVIVVGGGDSALECAIELKNSKAETKIVHRRDTFRATEKNVVCLNESCVEVCWNTEVKEIIGKHKVEKVKLFNNKDNSETEEKADAILLSLGTVPNTEFLAKIGVKLDEKNNVIVDGQMKTSVQGIFAAGDVVGRWVRIPEAVGEGGLAGLNAFKYIKNPYWK
ncbi:MAG: FAD-dependent oxidoreductase [Candidatus Altiarchaeota archaeon]|nr:FAD-dependent oxidoreductase [Candidatus Altiarchaeota archaeon]